jgi:hypothetical protein
VCNYCAKKGHKKPDCFFFKQDKDNNDLHPDKIKRDNFNRNYQSNQNNRNNQSNKNSNNSNNSNKNNSNVHTVIPDEEDEVVDGDEGNDNSVDDNNVNESLIIEKEDNKEISMTNQDSARSIKVKGYLNGREITYLIDDGANNSLVYSTDS